MKSRLVTTLTIALLATAATQAAHLNVGDKAPALNPTNWLKGQPFDPAAPHNGVSVVEFWATWCGPCIQSIPHLNDIAQKYADKNLRVVGVSVEDPGNTLDLVKNFLENRGDRIGYDIAFDALDDDGLSKMHEAYMEAADQSGIPTAFVVDKSGKIAWIGNPLYDPITDMEEVIEDLIDGSFDFDLARKLADISKRTDTANYDGDIDAILAAMDEVIALKPDNPRPWMHKFYFYSQNPEKIDDARLCAREALTRAEKNPRHAASVSATVISENDDYLCNDRALAILKKAHDADPADLETRVALFEALATLGKDDKALSLATDTINHMKGNAEELSQFAYVLSSPDRRKLCGDLALRAVELAIAADPEDPKHYVTKFNILNECKSDENAAKAVGEYLIQISAKDAQTLNAFAWNLLTDDVTKGKYNDLALAASEKLLKAPGGDGWMELDTAAYAYFENGKIEEAIKLEEQVLEKAPAHAKFTIESTLARFKQARTKKE